MGDSYHKGLAETIDGRDVRCRSPGRRTLQSATKVVLRRGPITDGSCDVTSFEVLWW